MVAAVVAMSGCDPAPRSLPPRDHTRDAFVSRPGAQTFPLAGRVVSADTAAGTITVAHDEIPNFMKAMTMSFAVKETWVPTAVKPGSLVTATLVVDGARTWLEQVVVADPGAQPLAPDEGRTPRP